VMASIQRSNRQLDNSTRRLRFVKLDRESLKLLIFTDSSFANNRDLSSQIGYILILTNSKDDANIVHWSSIKCKRIVRSVLASELYTMTNGFDIGTSIKTTINKALQINLPQVLYTDSKSLYNCLVKLGTTQEKRLMIDILCLRQLYKRTLISEVKWISTDGNPADALTNNKASTALSRLVDTNTVQLQTVGWVKRASPTMSKN